MHFYKVLLIVLIPITSSAELRSLCFGSIENETLLEAFSKEFPFCNKKDCDNFLNEEAQKLCPTFMQDSVTIEDASFSCSDITFGTMPNPDNPKENVKIRTSSVLIKEEEYTDFKVKCK